MWRWCAAIGAAVAIAAALVPAGAASAAPFPPHLDLAYELAVRYWGQEPTACAAIDKEVVPHGGLGTIGADPIAGLATQVAGQAPAGSVDCILWIDRTYAQPIVFSGLCALMIHETGHLLGFGHSPDPGSVMNETPPIPPMCAAKGRQLNRVLVLRRRLRRLRLRRGSAVAEQRALTQRALAGEAQRFWAVSKP